MLALLHLLAFGSAAADLKFTAFGDWGSGDDIQSATAKALGDKSAAFDSQFHVAIGDNFYEAGVKSTTDPLWSQRFEKMYTADSLQKPWYVVAGNHDHDGNAEAQLDYAKDSGSKRWTFPYYWWQKTFPIPGGSGSVLAVFIDTWMWPTTNADQIAFVKGALANSTATWKFVFGHYPVWSIAEHGPTDFLVKDLKPLLDQYKVDAYFCGHDHSMQFLQQGDVNYFLAGQGGKSDSSQAHKGAVPSGVSKWFTDQSEGGFITVQVNDTSATTTYWSSQKENQVYSVSQSPNSKAPLRSVPKEDYSHLEPLWFDYRKQMPEMYAARKDARLVVKEH